MSATNFIIFNCHLAFISQFSFIRTPALIIWEMVSGKLLAIVKCKMTNTRPGGAHG